jgi:hypothetical protein
MSIEAISFLLIVIVSLLLACLLGAGTGILAWLGGANIPNAILRAGVAAGGVLTLIAVVAGLTMTFADLNR